MNKSHLKELLSSYVSAVEERSFEDIVHCSNMFIKVLKRIAPIKDELDEEMVALTIKLQNTHVQALDIVRKQRDAQKAEIQQFPQYKNRAKAYAKTQISGQESR